MEEAPPDGENMSSDSSEELDSDEGTPRCRHSDSISQAEEEGEDREKLTGEPAVGPAGGACQRKPQWDTPLWGENHQSGVSGKVEKE